MKLNRITISIFSFALIFITGCLEISVNQPTQVPAGGTVSAVVQVVFSQDSQIGAGDDRTMMFAINKPAGWTIDTVTYVSPEHGTGHFNYLGDAPDADEDEGGTEDGWETALEGLIPSTNGMGWKMYESDRDTVSTSSAANPDTFNITVTFSNAGEGDFNLGYWVNLSNSLINEHGQSVFAPIGSGSPDVVINEIMYNPVHSTGSTNDDAEFLELYNNSPGAVDISGWSIVEGFGFTFPAGTSIPAHGYMVITRDSTEFFTQHGHYGNYNGGWDGNLSNSGEDITLVNASGVTVDSVYYDDGGGWPGSADGDGPSLELLNADLDNNLVASWAPSIIDKGTPGYARSALVTFSVDVSDTLQSGALTGAFNVVLKGDFPSADANPWDTWYVMDDRDGDSVYTRTDTLPTGKAYEYKFTVTGDFDGWSGWGWQGGAGVGSECDFNPNDPYDNYGIDLTNATQNVSLETVCFGSCHYCGWMPNLVLTLDVCQDTTPTSVRMAGPWWNNWDPNAGPVGVRDTVDTTEWVFTFSPHPTANMEYKYVIDGQFENLNDDVTEGWGGCAESVVWDANGAVQFANRMWHVGDPLDEWETFSSCNECGWMPHESDIVINEIHYNPAGAQGSDFAWEFMELMNVGDDTVNLEGSYFTEGVNHTFGEVHILPDSFLVVAVTDTLQVLGVVDTVVVWSSGNLGNGGEDILLLDSSGAVLDFVDYEDGTNDYGDWPLLADGGGTSLELKNPYAQNEYAENWIANTFRGTPGMANNLGDEHPMMTTITAIQQNCDSLGFSDYEGEYVQVHGIVTAVDRLGNPSAFTIQETSNDGSTAPWSGIYVFFGAPQLNIGDYAEVWAWVAEYRGYGALGDPNHSMTALLAGHVTVHGNMIHEGHHLSHPAMLTVSEAGSEPWEGVRVHVRGIVTEEAVFDPDADDYNYGEWTLTDSTGSINVNDRYFVSDPMLGAAMEVTGPINQWGGSGNTAPVWKIEPADAHDLAGPPMIMDVVDVPNDQGGRVYLHFAAAYGDQAGDGSGIGYTVLRMDPSQPGTPPHEVVVASGDAWGAGEYTYEVSTRHDSVGAGPMGMGITRLRVVANFPDRVFLSNMGMGYSVDNIAPGIPMGLFAQAGEGQSIMLNWDPVEAEDLTHYAVFRNTDPSSNEWLMIGETSEPFFLDENVDPGTYSYAVEAFDAVNGSGMSEATSVMLSNDGSVDLIPEEFALYNNHPNPFNPVTNIVYDIPEMADVSITIYNITGQRVHTLVQGQHFPGRYRVMWNATNDYGQPLASGMYIYMIRAGDFTSVKKLMLLK
ncbi:MAG: hypothetical protein CMG74_06560 [Candidatus Marinimicrobia bacterium]|nr:hypothetical protein [Candidatus Neomarinimicrobiota bacterium]|tara:strand:- start:3547 stop:7425 length:3879 start_codon:yes stop_codon:yes gene_type:complete